MNDIRFIYFDVGQVLVSMKGGFDEFCREYSFLGETGEVFWEEWGKYSDALCARRIRADWVSKRLREVTGVLLPESFSILDETVKRFSVIGEMQELLIELNTRYKIGLFSNAYEKMISSLLSQGKLPQIDYAAIVDSSECNLIKPESDIYKLAEVKSGNQGENIFFIDDKLENLQAAEQLKWATFLFNEEKTSEHVATLRKLLLA